MLREELSHSVKELKESLGLSYKELQDKSGCSTTSIRYALNGGSGVSLDVMDKLIKAMGATVTISLDIES